MPHLHKALSLAAIRFDNFGKRKGFTEIIWQQFFTRHLKQIFADRKFGYYPRMTKLLTIFFILILGSAQIVGQTSNLKLKIDSLQYLKQQPLTCNFIYWRVVAIGKEAIPFLIDKLDDTTHIQTSLTCKATNVKLGDICFEALTEILNIPLFYVTHQQFDFVDQYGCQQGVFNYLDNNRQTFKSQILAYYEKYKTKLKFIRYDNSYKNDCKKKYKVFGYYDVNWKLLDKK